MQDNTEVHRVVLPYRAWDLLELIGMEQAHTLLRQSVRYCVKAEAWPRSATWDAPRTLLPKLLDEYKLPGRSPGSRPADDAWISHQFIDPRSAETRDALGIEVVERGAIAEALAQNRRP